jgi:hypothetical protein
MKPIDLEVQMSPKTIVTKSQLKALKTIDLSPFINMSGLMVPRMVNVFIETLSKKEKGVFDKVLPVGGQRKIYTHLEGTPTPPIVISLARPLKMTTMSEAEVTKQNIKGIRINIDDMDLLTEGRMGKFLWKIKGQIGPMLGMTGVFAPFIKLGPRGLKDLKNKALIHFKPLMDMMPH